MSIYQKKVIDFLTAHNMNPYSIDIEKNCDLFVDEMVVGLNVANGGSLLMLPTYIKSHDNVPLEEPVIVIDAGGTNLRVALLSFNNSKQPVIDYFESYKMPGSFGEVTSEEFYDTLYEYLLPILDKTDKIGFCFSYPAEIYPNRDGKLLRFTKEMKISGLIGSMVGEGLLNKIAEKRRHGEKRVVMLNDTTATLLGGRASYPNRAFDGYIGLILGTGFNLAYIERAHKLGKLPEYKDSVDNMVINLEAGNYSRGPIGRIDDVFDEKTATPGLYRMEKSLSGAYQGGLIKAVIDQAAGEGLFSESFSKKLSTLKGLSSKDVDDFLFYPFNPVQSVLAALIPETDDAGIMMASASAGASCINHSAASAQAPALHAWPSALDPDRLTLFYIIDAIMERVAVSLVFALTAIAKKTQTGKSPCAPVCITAEGSTFYKSKLLQPKLAHYVKTFANERENIYLEFVKAENCVTVGAAIAALQNTIPSAL